VLRYLQKSFQFEAKSPAAEARAVKSIAHSKNSLADVNSGKAGEAREALRTWRTRMNLCDALSSREALWRISSSGRISSTSSSSLRR
jgi:hypothetical protein